MQFAGFIRSFTALPPVRAEHLHSKSFAGSKEAVLMDSICTGSAPVLFAKAPLSDTEEGRLVSPIRARLYLMTLGIVVARGRLSGFSSAARFSPAALAGGVDHHRRRAGYEREQQQVDAAVEQRVARGGQ